MAATGEKDPQQTGFGQKPGKHMEAFLASRAAKETPSYLAVMEQAAGFMNSLDDSQPVLPDKEVDTATLSGNALLNFDFAQRIQQLEAELGALGIDSELAQAS